jgi:AcrR family transcriptional regulator
VNAVVAVGARRTEILDTAASLFAASGVRTSLKEIADAVGILPGSLYHHFDSKEAIFDELIERYHVEVDAIAGQAQADLAADDSRSARQGIEAFGTALARCAVHNRAALLLTMLELPSGTSDPLAQRPSPMPPAVEAAMLETVRRGVKEGEIRSDVDAEMLADRLCQAMLHGSIVLMPDDDLVVDEAAAMRCRILLDGLALHTPGNDVLDASAAHAAAQRVADSWREPTSDDDARATVLRGVARAEFGRRGYEATTIRDIAAASGLSTASIYRRFGSKDELLGSIMRSFSTKVADGWAAVLASPATTVEKLDAVMWSNINVVDQFSDEYNVLQTWLREAPPSTRGQAWTFGARLQDLMTLLDGGGARGELRLDPTPTRARAVSLFDLVWLHENLVRRHGAASAMAFCRDTILRGAAAVG